MSLQRFILSAAMLALLPACQQVPVAEAPAPVAAKPAVSPQDVFFSNLSRLCGKAFEGKLVSTDAADADFRGKRIVMHVASCSEDEVRIPLHVGEDHSRTWVIRRAKEGLELRHEHRHEDGTADPLTWYGGYANDQSNERRLEAPADDFSKMMFERAGRSVSNTNVWTVEYWPENEKFSYQLARPERLFRLEFDTSKPVDLPPAPWGAK